MAWGAVAVAFEQLVVVEVAGELADAGAELLEGVEVFDPEHLLFEGLDELLDDAVGFGLVGERGRALEAEVIKLGLVVRRAEARAASWRSFRPAAAPALTEPKRSATASRSRSAAAQRSILGAASTHASPLA